MNASVSSESYSEQALEGKFSTMFRERALSGEGAWVRHARVVVALAAQAGVSLDEETLIVCDVHDLQALERMLRQAVEQKRSPAHAA
jgi:hypothetical protein